LWGWWAALRGRTPFEVRTALLNYPEGLTLQLIDPLDLLPAWAGFWVSPAAAFSAVLFAGVLVSGLAGWLLARESGADQGGQALGLCIGASCPTVLAVAVDGITEGLGSGWVGVQLALLLSLRRDTAWWRVCALTAAMTAGVHAGPYNGVWIALLDVPVGLWLLRHTRRHLLAAAAAMALCLPYALVLLARNPDLPGGANRSGPGKPILLTPWRAAARTGADLADLVVPAPFTGEAYDVPSTAYLGIVTVGLALCGRRWRWVLGAVAFAALALGPWFSVWGRIPTVDERELMAPAGWLAVYTPLGRISRWYRAGAVALLLLVPSAVRAVSGRRAWLLAGAVLLDARLLSPLPSPFPTTDARPSPALQSLEGPIAELPPVHPLFRDDQPADENLLLQVWHGQPTTGTLHNAPGSATVHPALRTLRRVLVGRAEAGDDVREAGSELAALGYRSLAVYRGRLPHPGLAAFSSALGPAVAEDDRVTAFRLP
jgi:hypothetical protein